MPAEALSATPVTAPAAPPSVSAAVAQRIQAGVAAAPDAPTPPTPSTEEAPKEAGEAKGLDPKAADREARIAKAFAGMSKKEKALVAQQRKIAEEKAEVALRLEEINKAKKDLEIAKAARDEARANPLKFLESAGLSYNDVASFVMNNNSLTPEASTKAEIDQARRLAEKAREEFLEFKRQQEEAQSAAEEQRKQKQRKDVEDQLESFRAGAVDFVAKNSEQYELTNIYSMQHEVPALMEELYKQRGEKISLKEAAERVENYLLETLEKATASKRWSKRQAEKAPPPAPEADAKQGAETIRRTIDNSLNATITAKPVNPPKVETEEERMARAVAAYKAARSK